MRKKISKYFIHFLTCIIALQIGWVGSVHAQVHQTGIATKTLKENHPPKVESKQSQSPVLSPGDPWQANQLMKPEELVKILSNTTGEKPLVLFVGFPVLYQNGHIAGSKMVGPTSTPEGMQKLKNEVQGLPRDRQIILYCGCCPLSTCPNIRPAFLTMKELGFKNISILYLPHNFQQDWIYKGYPIEKSNEQKRKSTWQRKIWNTIKSL